MPAIAFSYNLLRGMSDFWQRFFADADQLASLYKGTAIQIGQAYLDYMSAVLGVSLKDAVALDREYYKLIAIREDETTFEEGATTADNRWAFKLPDDVVAFASLDNRVFEPTVALEPNLDYEIVNRVVKFRVDPTDTGAGLPIVGFARRQLDVSVGGTFTDPTSTAVTTWLAALVKKGDTLRILDVGTDGTQRKRADYVLRVVRSLALYVDPSTPFPTTPTPPPLTSVNYVILRVPPVPRVIAESFTTVAFATTLAHTRLDAGSVRVFAKAPGGADVVEGVDYIVNYEHGKIFAQTVWQGMSGGGAGTFAADYTWREEIVPSTGASPRLATTGVISTSTTTVKVVQMTAWAPDARVDRRTLSNNFGALIGREGDSSEPYRAFLEGIFQLYILGPVLQRIESALNVVLNLPVVRDDGEIYQSTDTSDPRVDRVLTARPVTGQTATYEFPKGTPLRPDLVAGLELLSFEPLTTAVAVTDYVQTPQWWHGEVIPKELFSGTPPNVSRRTASQAFVEHVIGATDEPEIGDPSLYIGASDDGDPTLFPPGHPVFRHRMAFVVMDRYMKVHTFSVKFSATAISAALGSSFAQSLSDLNELVLTAKPSHTYVFTTPGTAFRDEIQIVESPVIPTWVIGRVGPDKVVFADNEPVLGAGVWNVGDYWKYELFTTSTAFPVLGTPVTLANAPSAPRHGRLVLVYPAGTIGGLRLIENVDYSVNYVTRQVTRLTVWDATTVNVTYRQLNIGNVVDVPAGAGDMLLTTSNVDPSIITGAFDPVAKGWDGTVNPVTAPRDMGMVERALIVNPH